MAWKGMAGAFLVLALSLGAQTSAWAADSPLDQELSASEAAYGALNFDESSRRAEALTKRRGLSHDQLVRAYRVLALSRGAMGEDEKARDAFVQLLTFDPDHKVEKSLGPKVQQPFLEAKGFWRNQMQKPGVEASLSPLRQGTTATLRIVTRDPTHVVKGVTVGWRFGGDGAYATSSVGTGEQSLTIRAAPAGESRLDYYVQALDAMDSVAFEVGNPQGPRTSLVEMSRAPSDSGPRREPGRQESSSIFSSPLFWVATVVVVGGGVAGGYLLATREAEQRSLPPTAANVGPILFCGIERCR